MKKPKSKSVTKYLHTNNGKPATYKGQICYIGYNKATKLVDSLSQIQKEQRLSIKWREKRGMFDNPSNKYGWIKIAIVCLLCFFLPDVKAQGTGELRNNPTTQALEIYLDVVLSLDWDTTETGYDYYKENKFTKWCNVDSLYEKHGKWFRHSWGLVDLGYIIWQRKLFNLFTKEKQGKK